MNIYRITGVNDVTFRPFCAIMERSKLFSSPTQPIFLCGRRYKTAPHKQDDESRIAIWLRHLAVSFFILETSKRKAIMDVETLRENYLPNKIKVLFVAEAKPDANDRFFYYDKVKTHDHLYLYLMYALYEKTNDDRQYLRDHKADFLSRFMDDGYYLVDAVDEIKSNTSSPKRTMIIRENAANKIPEIRELLAEHGDQNTKIVLIKTTVFDALYDLMKDDFNIINDFKIYFPSNGRETDFLKQMNKVKERLHI